MGGWCVGVAVDGLGWFVPLGFFGVDLEDGCIVFSLDVGVGWGGSGRMIVGE